MAQNTIIQITPGVWTQITDADVTGNITFQNRSQHPITIKATTDTTAPTNGNGGIVYGPGEGEQGKTIAELFPGLTSPDRLWGHAPLGGKISVSHG